jgi:hypothetical protein
MIWFRSWIILSIASMALSAQAAQTVIVGDSMTCGPFGQNLFRRLVNDHKQDVTLYCAVSSAPEHWLQGTKPPGQICQTMSTASPRLTPCGGNGSVPTFARILERHPDATVIVALGTNSLGSPRASAAYSEMSKLGSANGRGCRWIGPPHLNPSQAKGFSTSRLQQMESHLGAFYSSLSERVGNQGCRLIRSLEATQPGTAGHQTTDGVHRTREAGSHWVNGIISDLELPSRAGSTTTEARKKTVN